MAYQYKNSKGTNYYLHSQEVKLRGSGKNQTIYYFAREVKGNHGLDQVPAGFVVVESQKTGLPVLKRG